MGRARKLRVRSFFLRFPLFSRFSLAGLTLFLVRQLIHQVTENPTATKLIEEGNRLRNSGDWINAEESYVRATEIDPENRGAWTELGFLLADSRRFDEAAFCLRKIARNGASTVNGP